MITLSWHNLTFDDSAEIRIRIEKTIRNNFDRMKMVLCKKDMSLPLRIKLARCNVFTVLLYGAEAWALDGAAIRIIEAFEMWVYRCVLKISWMEVTR